MKKQFKFQNFQYDINDILTYKDIELCINKFYCEILATYDLNEKFCILFKVKTSDGDWRNISSLQTLDKNSIEDLKEIFNLFWSFKSDQYKSLDVEKIVFRFRPLETDIAPIENIFRYPTEFDKSTDLLPQGYTNLPNNRQFETWGDELIINGDNTYVVKKDNYSFLIRELNNEYFVSVNYKDKEILSFHDIYEAGNERKNTNTFMRTIGSSTIYYKDGQCNLLFQNVLSNYIKGKNPDTSIKKNYITMDLETRSIDNVMSVIAACIYDGNTCKSFYLTDYTNSEELLKESITYLLQRKYNGFKVYIHNFSKFDAVFMLRIMAKMTTCEVKRCLKRDSKIIDIKLSYNLEAKRNYSIYFRDSLLLLPSSLKKLGENFNVEIKKGIYPYTFVNNINVSLDYKGPIPSHKYFEKVTKIEDLKEYIKYVNFFKDKQWSLRDETLKYCKNDVISLYLIIHKFQVRIFRLFETDINKYPTLSSLAFSIYRIKYLKKHQIPCITGELYRHLKKSYSGGSVDVYKPIGKDINRYDVNSLYPSVMANCPSPVGKITKFKGDILKHKENPFGFFFVNIKTPENLYIPILQTRVKTKVGGIRTVSPLGEWSGWYFSEEILNAKKHGYHVEIVWGYLFEKDYIFKEYVSDLYELKKKSERDSPDFIISKLLLNSLYGRFGMSPDKDSHDIVKGEDEMSKYLKLNHEGKIQINDTMELDENIDLISYTKKNISNEDEISSFTNINVAIASSITAYARIMMSEIKTEYSNNIYYSDTDSIDLDIKLPEKYLTKNLGDYKLEKTFKEVVYVKNRQELLLINNSFEPKFFRGKKV